MTVDEEISALCQSSPASKGTISQAIRLNTDTWQELHREDPQLHRIEVGIAHCARIMATLEPGNVIYANARLEDRALRDRRQQLLEARATARRVAA